MNSALRLLIVVSGLALHSLAQSNNQAVLWCREGPGGACNPGTGQGCLWHCNCDGSICEMAMVGPWQQDCQQPPQGAPKYTVNQALCTHVSCAFAGDACGNPADTCDTSACRAAGTPTFQLNSTDPTKGRIVGLPVCVIQNSCSATLENSKNDDGICRPLGFGKSGGSEDIGDPVIAGTRYSSHANIDFSIASSIGKFDFVRMYTSSPIFWEQADGIGPLPGPFGKDMAWTHNLFSFVQEVPNGNCLTRVPPPRWQPRHIQQLWSRAVLPRARRVCT